MDEPTNLPARRGLRILIVDDSADTTEMTALALCLHGHEVWTAADGPTALQVFQEQKPEAVLLDIGLPRMSGWEVARQLRELTGPHDKRPFLVAITGYGGSENELRSAEAGIDLHLLKPVDVDELLQLLLHFRGLVDKG
jgi:two-component system CheB/CheR fusion protein